MVANFRALVQRGGSAIQIQDMDKQIVMTRRGMAAIASGVVYHYYGRGLKQCRGSARVEILPPHVRVVLARLRWAAEGRIYCCPADQTRKNRRKMLRELRRNVAHAEQVFNKVARITKDDCRKNFHTCCGSCGTTLPMPRKFSRKYNASWKVKDGLETPTSERHGRATRCFSFTCVCFTV